MQRESSTFFCKQSFTLYSFLKILTHLHWPAKTVAHASKRSDCIHRDKFQNLQLPIKITAHSLHRKLLINCRIHKSHLIYAARALGCHVIWVVILTHKIFNYFSPHFFSFFFICDVICAVINVWPCTQIHNNIIYRIRSFWNSRALWNIWRLFISTTYYRGFHYRIWDMTSYYKMQ